MHTTWDVQTLYFKNWEGKLDLSKSESRKVNGQVHLFIG